MMTRSNAFTFTFIIWYIKNMNKNKIIFAIIWLILIWFIVFWVLSLKTSNELNNTSTNKTQFSIWIFWDDKKIFEEFINDFKVANSNYKNANIVVESFSDYEEYYLALWASLANWKSPDIFVLNNSEKNSIFSNIIKWLNPEIINPNDFRKNFKWVFSDDLVLTYTPKEWEKTEQIEYVIWIPVWYETLWVFYNARYVKDNDLKSLSSLNSIISELKEKYPDVIPFWMWNWSTVYNSADIITQFFMFDNWIWSLNDIDWEKIKQAFSTYFMYWDEQWDNNYNSRFSELMSSWKDNLSLFSNWEIFMIAWYQSLINKIDKNGYSASLLRAAPFPHYFTSEWKTLVNYNYFVLNDKTLNSQLGYDFLKYLNSDIWATAYLKRFPYYLPALLSLETDKLEEKIHPNYKVVLKDFLENNPVLSSFDKWMKSIYDKSITNILDDSNTYETQFEKSKKNIICKTKKFTEFTDLSKSCEE